MEDAPPKPQSQVKKSHPLQPPLPPKQQAPEGAIAREVEEQQHECCICLDQITYPTLTPCGHTFCLKCILAYFTSLQTNYFRKDNYDEEIDIPDLRGNYHPFTRGPCPYCRLDVGLEDLRLVVERENEEDVQFMPSLCEFFDYGDKNIVAVIPFSSLNFTQADSMCATADPSKFDSQFSFDSSCLTPAKDLSFIQKMRLQKNFVGLFPSADVHLAHYDSSLSSCISIRLFVDPILLFDPVFVKFVSKSEKIESETMLEIVTKFTSVPVTRESPSDNEGVASTVREVTTSLTLGDLRRGTQKNWFHANITPPDTARIAGFNDTCAISGVRFFSKLPQNSLIFDSVLVSKSPVEKFVSKREIEDSVKATLSMLVDYKNTAVLTEKLTMETKQRERRQRLLWVAGSGENDAAIARSAIARNFKMHDYLCFAPYVAFLLSIITVYYALYVLYFLLSFLIWFFFFLFFPSRLAAWRERERERERERNDDDDNNDISDNNDDLNNDIDGNDNASNGAPFFIEV